MPITYSEQFLKIRLCVKVSGVDSSATAEGAGRVKVTAQQRNGVRKETGSVHGRPQTSSLC